MAEIAARIEPVADPPLELFCIREAAVGIALPDRLPVIADRENAAGAGDKRHFGKIRSECRQKLLSQPAGAQQPLALGAICNDDPRPSHLQPHSRALAASAFRLALIFVLAHDFAQVLRMSQALMRTEQ